MTDRRIRIIIDSRQAERNAQRLERGVTNVGRSADNAGFAVKRLVTAIASALAVDKIVKYADAWTDVNNQIIRTVDSEEELIKTSTELLRVSNDTLTGLKETTAIYTSLSVSTKNLGVTQSEVIDVTKTINNLFREGGKSAAETAGAIRQLGQALESGTLRGDEFNSVAEGAPGILRAVELQTGMTRAELRAFAAEGSIDAGLLVKSLQAYEKQAQSAADKTRRTYAQSIIVANNNISAFIGSNKQLISVIDSAGDFIVYLSESLSLIPENIAFASASMDGFSRDIARLSSDSSLAVEQMALDFASIGEFLSSAFANAGPNIRAFVQLMTIEVAGSIERVVALAQFAKTSIGDLSFDEASKQLEIDMARINSARVDSIDLILQEADATKENARVKFEAAQALRIESQSLGVERTTSSFSTSSAAKPKDKSGEKSDSFSTELEAQTASLQRQLDLRSSITAIHRQNEANANASQFEQDRAAQQIQEEVSLAELEAKNQEDLARNSLSFENKLATLVLQDEQEKALRAEFDNQQLINDQLFQQQKTAIEQEGAKDREAIARLEAEAKISAYSGLAKSGLAILQSFGSQSFQSQKNFAIAGSAVSIAGGVAQALNNPYPANLGFAAQVATQGAQLVRTIKSTKPGGGATAPSISSAPVSTPSLTASNVQPEERRATTYNISGVKPDEIFNGRQLAELLKEFGEDGGTTINFVEG